MYHSNMVICSVSVIAIFSRAKHINSCCILFKDFHIIADIRRNSFGCFSRSNEREYAGNAIIPLQSFTTSRFTKQFFKIVCFPC